MKHKVNNKLKHAVRRSKLFRAKIFKDKKKEQKKKGVKS